ncbi:MAG TPA: hypothetical protein VHE30_12700 [Polyangiaceae bacterium]|nr:hypothetical protein [Polyangiaceae bacterium]
MTGYVIAVWLHVVAAAVWVGSMVFFAAAIVPVVRSQEFRAVAPALVARVGARFRVLGWISLGILFATGLANLHYRGVGFRALADGTFWATGFGRAFAWKLVLVAVVVVLTALHDAVTAGRSGAALRQPPTSEDALRARRRASYVGRAVLLASLGILFFAVAMVRGFLG